MAGERALGEGFAETRREILTRKRAPAALAAEIKSMRRRMREVKDKSDDSRWDVKQMPSGLVDIEFIAQFAALAHGHRGSELLIFTDAIRILETLESAGMASCVGIKTLTNAYRRYRRRIHADAPQRQRAMIGADQWRGLRDAVAAIWQDWLAAPWGAY